MIWYYRLNCVPPPMTNSYIESWWLYSEMGPWWSFGSIHSLSHVQLFATPWTAACQASLSITNSWSLLKFISIESVMPSNHLILCHPLLLLPSIFPSIRVISDESGLCIRWTKYWTFSFSISTSSEHSGFISFRIDVGYPCSPRDSKSLIQHHSSKASILRKLWYLYTMEYYSAIKNNSFESVLMRWDETGAHYTEWSKPER